ncbi:MAG: sugar phosphate nucleotidyltransferase [Vicinamibacterales bacterium]
MQSELAGPWAVVLAGGEGERLRPLVQRWLGRHRPKQYCAFTGTRSMFQHTVDRASAVALPSRIVTVAAHGHQADVEQQLADRPTRATLFQPENRDTGAGVFLPLAYIRANEPEATVLILPSDHFVSQEERFVEAAKGMLAAAERLPDRVVLLAVKPDRPEVEYGWVEPGEPVGEGGHPSVRGISRFIEKPPAVQARVAMADGALWNTLVMTARLDTLWALGWRCFPDMMPLFEEVVARLRRGATVDLDGIYSRMSRRNFSADLLAQVPDRVAVVEADGFTWCDWGRAERILETLAAVGRAPAFPPELVATVTPNLALPEPDPTRAVKVTAPMLLLSDGHLEHRPAV